MTEHRSLIPTERIERSILLIRGHKVIIDADLAELYGVPTKAFNQGVKRNIARFPEDFMFRLTKEEKREVVTNCDHLKRLKFSPTLPYVFTEHGAIMAANILNSERAVQASVQVVRAFVRMRQLLASQKGLMQKILDMEKKYDRQFKSVFDAIRALMMPPESGSKNTIGFRVDEKKGK